MQLRKIAVGALGLMTAMSTVAFAATLDTYPAPFASGGNLDSLIVVGSGAKAESVVGASLIAARLAGESYTSVSTGAGTVEGAEQDDVNIDEGVSVDLGSVFDDDDIAVLADSSITFDGDEIDFHDEIRLAAASPSLETSLTSGDDDYGSDVRVEITSDSLQYFYVFDESINLSKISSSKPLEIDLLGRRLKVVDQVDQDTLKVRVGEEHTMQPGDSVTVGGKTVTLTAVGTDNALINVDGTSRSIDEDVSETISGLEILLEDAFNDDGVENDFAILIIGEDAEKTYNNGDSFIGEDDSSSKAHWHWILNDLNETAKGGTGTTDDDLVTIGVQSKFRAIEVPASGSAQSVEPLKEGESWSFPFDFVSLDFVELTVPEDNFAELTIRFDSGIDLSNAYSAFTSEPVFVVESDVDDVIALDDGAAGWAVDKLSTDVFSDTIYIHMNASNGSYANVFYVDNEGDVQLAGILNHNASSNRSWGYVDYRKTSGSGIDDADVVLQTSADGMGSVGANLNLTFNVTTTGVTEGIVAVLGRNGTGNGAVFDALGDDDDQEEAGELVWDISGAFGPGGTTLGTKDEDHRSRYGIAILNPESNGASDQVILQVPGDVLEATIRLGGEGTTSTEGTTKAVKPVTAAVVKLDKDVSEADEESNHLVLVGGPCVNSLVAELAAADNLMRDGAKLDCAGWIATGENFGIIRIVDDFFGAGKSALIVAGTRAEDSVLGAQIIQNYHNFADELTGTGVEYSGSGLSSVAFV